MIKSGYFKYDLLVFFMFRRGYWGNKIGDPHTVPMKVSGKCGSVRVRLIPAPRGTHIVGAPTTKKILAFAGIKDCFSSSNGSTKTRGNFMKVGIVVVHSTLVRVFWKLFSGLTEAKACGVSVNDYRLCLTLCGRHTDT